MRAGILLIVLYWALFTIRAGLQPKVAAEVKAATYDMKRASGLEKLEHTRRLQCWTVAKWALRVCGWAENVLLGVVILWVAFLLGAVLTGTVIVFGYPVKGALSMKLTKCEQCGGPTAEGLPLCPDCMRATGAAVDQIAAAEELRDIARVLSITANTDANIREAIVGILNIAERLERGK